MTPDPLLQELMAEFDELFDRPGAFLYFQGRQGGAYRATDRIKAFLTSAVLRTRIDAFEKAKEVLLTEGSKALTALKETNPSTP